MRQVGRRVVVIVAQSSSIIDEVVDVKTAARSAWLATYTLHYGRLAIFEGRLPNGLVA